MSAGLRTGLPATAPPAPAEVQEVPPAASALVHDFLGG